MDKLGIRRNLLFYCSFILITLFGDPGADARQMPRTHQSVNTTTMAVCRAIDRTIRIGYQVGKRLEIAFYAVGKFPFQRFSGPCGVGSQRCHLGHPLPGASRVAFER